MLAASIGLGVAGTATSAMGQISQGNAEAAKYKYQSSIALINKDIALQNARYERDAGEVEAQKVGLAGRYRMGMIRAGQGAGGFDVNFGSNQRVQESQQSVISHDEDVVRANAARRAYGHEIEATSATNQSKLYEASASNAKTAAMFNATSTILEGASKVAGKWYGASSAGLTLGSSGGGGGHNSGSSLEYN